MVLLKIKLQKEAYFPGEEVEGWMELKHKGFKPTVIDKLVMKIDGEESENVMVMQTAQTTSRQTLIDCKQILLDQQVSFGPGTYYFPFTFTLPEYLPVSGAYGRQDRKYQVAYSMKAFALKHKDAELVTISCTSEPIPVFHKFELENKQPATTQLDLPLIDKGQQVGKLACIMRLGTRNLEPESTLDMFLEVENVSDLTIKLYVAIAGICTVYGSSVTKEESITQFHTPVLLGKVEPNDTTQFRRNLTIPLELGGSPTTRNTQLFQQKYQVQLVCTPAVYGVKTDGTLALPIMIAGKQAAATTVMQKLPHNVQQVFRPVIIDLFSSYDIDFSETEKTSKLKSFKGLGRRLSRGHSTDFNATMPVNAVAPAPVGPAAMYGPGGQMPVPGTSFSGVMPGINYSGGGQMGAAYGYQYGVRQG